MRERTRKILDLIDEELLACAKKKDADPFADENMGELWDILSALRGPDASTPNSMQKFAAKDETTIHIRRAAFPRLAQWCDEKHKWYTGLGAQIKTKSPFTYVNAKQLSSHFYEHMACAAYVLGLKPND